MKDKIRSEPFVTILGNVLAVAFLTVHIDAALMSRLASTSPSGPKGEQPESSVAARRQSWTLPVQELEDLRAARRRSRHLQDENHSPDWSTNLQSLIKTRRPSFAPTLPEYFRQARKPRVEEAEETLGPEIVQPVDTRGLPESPEEGKTLRSSLEINVKDLVGDAVGNVRHFNHHPWS
jgi:hypothetical protein